MALGFEAKLSAKKLFGLISVPLELDAVMKALRAIQYEDFGIPDLAVQNGIRPGQRPTITVTASEEAASLQVGFGGEAVITFQLQKHELCADYVTTSLFGPGFHAMAIHFCERLAEKAGLKLAIDDETAYFSHRDFAKLKRSFVEWFRTLLENVNQVRVNSTKRQTYYLCWALDKYRLKDTIPGVITPGGFYRYEKMKEMVDNIESAADDLFLLLPNAAKDALHYRNLAMSKLWCDYRFSADDDDRKLGNEIADELEIAGRLNPLLPFPKAAYLELTGKIGREAIALDGLADDNRFPTVGFRKFPICCNWGHWRIEMPGETPYRAEPGSSFLVERVGLRLEMSELILERRDGMTEHTPLPSYLDVASSDPRQHEELRRDTFPYGEGRLFRYDDSEFPFFLHCSLAERAKDNPRKIYLLVITGTCASEADADAACAIVRECRYVEQGLMPQ